MIEKQMEALQQYKTLLDNGLISPEEYEKKKRQILGLDEQNISAMIEKEISTQQFDTSKPPIESAAYELLNQRSSKEKNPVYSIELNKENTTKKKRISVGVSLLCICLFILLAVSVSLDVYWYNSFKNFEKSYYSLAKENESLKNRIEDYDKTLTKTKDEKKNLQKEVTQLNSKIAFHDTFSDAINSFEPEKPHKNFFSSSEILVVKKGEKKTVNFFVNYPASVALSWEWTGAIYTDSSSGDWNYDKGIPCFPVYIKGLKAGTSTYTFSNTFK